MISSTIWIKKGDPTALMKIVFISLFTREGTMTLLGEEIDSTLTPSE